MCSVYKVRRKFLNKMADSLAKTNKKNITEIGHISLSSWFCNSVTLTLGCAFIIILHKNETL